MDQSILKKPCVWEFSKYLLDKSQSNNLIYVTAGKEHNLKIFNDKYDILVITIEEYINYYINLNYDTRSLNNINNIKDLENSVIIADNILEQIDDQKTLNKFLETIKLFANTSKYLLFTSDYKYFEKKHSNSQFLDEKCFSDDFCSFLIKNNLDPYSVGYTRNNNYTNEKNALLSIFGRETVIKKVPNVTCLAIISTFNEKDIILEVVSHLLNQGLDVYIMDNWSTDNTYEILVKEYQKNNRVTITRFPIEKPEHNQYKWHEILLNKEKVAIGSNYDWIIHHDADEIRYSPWKNIKLIEAISWVDYLGYNAIDFSELVFRFTDINLSIHEEFEKNLLDYEFGRRDGHFLRVNTWKNNEDVSLAEYGGHNCEFPSKKVFPLKFLMKHYPLRNEEHAIEKIFKDRLPRFKSDRKKYGWHGHYDKHQRENIKTWKDYNLLYYEENKFNKKYLIERLSGIGIIRDNSSAIDKNKKFKDEINKLNKKIKKEERKNKKSKEKIKKLNKKLKKEDKRNKKMRYFFKIKKILRPLKKILRK